MLSKSQYIRGLQCNKSLWLYKNKPELRSQPTEQEESLFESGNQVGDLACQLFPGGIEIEFDSSDFDGMIRKTKDLIEQGQTVIYEAAFKENGIFAMADILVKNGNVWDMYEVKGSTSVKPYHLDDASVQWYALSNAITLNRAYIVHINNEYVRQGELDIHQLFRINDITDIVLENQSVIPQRVKHLESMIKGDEPQIDIGGHCFDPHDCDFHDHCWKHIPEISVFNLYRMNFDKKLAFYKQGMIRLEDIPVESISNPTQIAQLKSTLDRKIIFNPEPVNDFLNSVKYPIHFFDFETFQDAIPRFDNQRPYMQMPFQYSLHILHEDGTIEHKEFLGDENEDPREALIKQMIHDILPGGSVMAYNQAFEKSRISEMAAMFPTYRDKLMAMHERFVDLIVPFRALGYYHPDFNGSFSIKSVLPAMFPNDPELDYKKLEIQNGGMAMDTFANLHRLKDKSKREGIRQALLAYCHLDTLAMVRIYEQLQELVKD